MQKSCPPPKVGPQEALPQMVLVSLMRSYFSLRVMEKRKDLSVVPPPVTQLPVEFHLRGVKPPIILPNSVLARTSVLATPSHFWWKVEARKLFSLARQSSLNWQMGLSNQPSMSSLSSVTFDSSLMNFFFSSILKLSKIFSKSFFLFIQYLFTLSSVTFSSSFQSMLDITFEASLPFTSSSLCSFSSLYSDASFSFSPYSSIWSEISYLSMDILSIASSQHCFICPQAFTTSGLAFCLLPLSCSIMASRRQVWQQTWFFSQDQQFSFKHIKELCSHSGLTQTILALLLDQHRKLGSGSSTTSCISYQIMINLLQTKLQQYNFLNTYFPQTFPNHSYFHIIRVLSYPPTEQTY